MSAAWTEFYKGRVLSQGYRDYCSERYAPYLDEIKSWIKEGDRVVEVGCGLATMTALLADNRGANGNGTVPFCGFHCYDISPDMVALATLNLHEGYPVDVGDAKLPTGCRPDVIHSHGMLEHFCDEDIRRVINAHRMDGARVAIHYVPGEKYKQPSFGDERLMSLEQWHDIAGWTEAFSFNDGFDHCLVWKL